MSVQFSHHPPDRYSTQAQLARPHSSSGCSLGQEPDQQFGRQLLVRLLQTGIQPGNFRRPRLILLLAILVGLLTNSLGGRAIAQTALLAAADQTPAGQTPSDQTPAAQTPAAQTPEPAGLPTANFVPQATLDAAQRLAVQNMPSLPGLGQPDKFLPDLDPLAQIHLVIRLSERRVYVYNRDQVKTSFPVAIGRAGWETPVGKYQVIQMQHDPTWEHPFTGELVPPGRDNPLGVRWIGFWTDGTNYIGFHGTPNEESVGRPASHGCVRMFNQDVVKLFEMVRLGTPVEVVP